MTRVLVFQPKACLTCGTEFIPTSGVQRYCTKACKPYKFIPAPCAVCGRVGQVTKGLCDAHYRQMRHHGVILNSQVQLQPRGEHPTYKTVHRRLRRLYGKAADHPCADCGAPAREWAFDNGEPQWLGERGMYHDDLTRYRPLCSKCHWVADNLS